MATYYNTTGVDLDELKQRIKNCRNQNDRMYELFKVYGFFTKWEAKAKYEEYYGKIKDGPTTRSLCTLADEKKIYKSSNQIREREGAMNYVYKLYPTDGKIPEDICEEKPKSIKIEVKMTEVYGQTYLDVESMRREFENKIDKLINKLERNGTI